MSQHNNQPNLSDDDLIIVSPAKRRATIRSDSQTTSLNGPSQRSSQRNSQQLQLSEATLVRQDHRLTLELPPLEKQLEAFSAKTILAFKNQLHASRDMDVKAAKQTKRLATVSAQSLESFVIKRQFPKALGTKVTDDLRSSQATNRRATAIKDETEILKAYNAQKTAESNKVAEFFNSSIQLHNLLTHLSKHLHTATFNEALAKFPEPAIQGSSFQLASNWFSEIFKYSFINHEETLRVCKDHLSTLSESLKTMRQARLEFVAKLDKAYEARTAQKQRSYAEATKTTKKPSTAAPATTTARPESKKKSKSKSASDKADIPTNSIDPQAKKPAQATKGNPNKDSVSTKKPAPKKHQGPPANPMTSFDADDFLAKMQQLLKDQIKEELSVMNAKVNSLVDQMEAISVPVSPPRGNSSSSSSSSALQLSNLQSSVALRSKHQTALPSPGKRLNRPPSPLPSRISVNRSEARKDGARSNQPLLLVDAGSNLDDATMEEDDEDDDFRPAHEHNKTKNRHGSKGATTNGSASTRA